MPTIKFSLNAIPAHVVITDERTGARRHYARLRASVEGSVVRVLVPEVTWDAIARRCDVFSVVEATGELSEEYVSERNGLSYYDLVGATIARPEASDDPESRTLPRLKSIPVERAAGDGESSKPKAKKPAPTSRLADAAAGNAAVEDDEADDDEEAGDEAEDDEAEKPAEGEGGGEKPAAEK